MQCTYSDYATVIELSAVMRCCGQLGNRAKYSAKGGWATTTTTLTADTMKSKENMTKIKLFVAYDARICCKNA